MIKFPADSSAAQKIEDSIYHPPAAPANTPAVSGLNLISDLSPLDMAREVGMALVLQGVSRPVCPALPPAQNDSISHPPAAPANTPAVSSASDSEDSDIEAFDFARDVAFLLEGGGDRNANRLTPNPISINDQEPQFDERENTLDGPQFQGKKVVDSDLWSSSATCNSDCSTDSESGSGNERARKKKETITQRGGCGRWRNLSEMIFNSIQYILAWTLSGLTSKLNCLTFVRIRILGVRQHESSTSKNSKFDLIVEKTFSRAH